MLCRFGPLSVESLLMSLVTLLICGSLKLCECFFIEGTSARWSSIFTMTQSKSSRSILLCSIVDDENCKKKNLVIVWCYTRLVFNPILSCSLDQFSNFYSLDANSRKARI